MVGAALNPAEYQHLLALGMGYHFSSTSAGISLPCEGHSRIVLLQTMFSLPFKAAPPNCPARWVEQGHLLAPGVASL